LKAWTLLTALDDIRGHEEQLGRSRPQDKPYSRDFHGPNWFDIGKRQPPTMTAIRPCWWLAAARPDCPSPHALINYKWTRSLSTGGNAAATIGASVTTRWCCTTGSTSITCPTCGFRQTGRPTFPKTRLPAGSRPMSRAWSSIIGWPLNSLAAAMTNATVDGP